VLDWFRALMPRQDRFFPLFRRHAELLAEGAASLDRLLAGGDAVARECRTIVELERQADDVTREVLRAIRRSFITPFDRGDIKDLIQSMDDAIDMMQVTVKTVELFGLVEFEPEMRGIGKIVVEVAALVAEAVPLLDQPSRNVARLTLLTEKVVAAEGRADDLHDAGLKVLFERLGRTDPMAFLIGQQVYGALERVVDRFEDVANEISGIVIESV
jgi:uncharacterized protein Yka (UPF0111/DUF47 family)